MFKTIGQIDVTPTAAPSRDAQIETARKVFKALHGQYGNLFLSRYATGALENGEDTGVAGAMGLWGHSLRRYDESTIKAALTQCMTDHVQYPPNLPEFLRICEARRPREAYKPPVLALPVAPALLAQRTAAARERVAAQAEFMRNRNRAGLAPLKQAIADAVATAGGDEVATLLRMDRIFAKGAVAHV